MAIELKKYRHQIVLDVLDFVLDKQHITRLLGIEPTYSHTKGERRTATANFKRSHWAFYSNAAAFDSDFEDHVNDFLSHLNGKDDVLRKVRDIATVEVTIICLYSNSSKPSVRLGLDFLSFLHRNGIPVDIDFSALDG